MRAETRMGAHSFPFRSPSFDDENRSTLLDNGPLGTRVLVAYAARKLFSSYKKAKRAKRRKWVHSSPSHSPSFDDQNRALLLDNGDPGLWAPVAYVLSRVGF